MVFFDAFKSCTNYLGNCLQPVVDMVVNVGKRAEQAVRKMLSHSIPCLAHVAMPTSLAYFFLTTVNYSFNWDYQTGMGSAIFLTVGLGSSIQYIYHQYHSESKDEEYAARLRTGFRSGLTTISVVATLGYSQGLTLVQDAGFTIATLGLTFTNSVYQAMTMTQFKGTTKKDLQREIALLSANPNRSYFQDLKLFLRKLQMGYRLIVPRSIQKTMSRLTTLITRICKYDATAMMLLALYWNAYNLPLNLTQMMMALSVGTSAGAADSLTQFYRKTYRGHTGNKLLIALDGSVVANYFFVYFIYGLVLNMETVTPSPPEMLALSAASLLLGYYHQKDYNPPGVPTLKEAFEKVKQFFLRSFPCLERDYQRAPRFVGELRREPVVPSLAFPEHPAIPSSTRSIVEGFGDSIPEITHRTLDVREMGAVAADNQPAMMNQLQRTPITMFSFLPPPRNNRPQIDTDLPFPVTIDSSRLAYFT